MGHWLGTDWGIEWDRNWGLEQRTEGGGTHWALSDTLTGGPMGLWIDAAARRWGFALVGLHADGASGLRVGGDVHR